MYVYKYTYKIIYNIIAALSLPLLSRIGGENKVKNSWLEVKAV